MHTAPSTASFSEDERLLETLQRLLALAAPELRSTLDQASTWVAEAVDAEKVDVFLYQAEKESLVALGTSDTPLGHIDGRVLIWLKTRFIARRGPNAQGRPSP